MMRRGRRLLAATAAAGALAAGGAVAAGAPAQAAGSCKGAGYLCFLDYESATYGNVSSNNDRWGDFGWNNRADWFRNDGTRCNVRIYDAQGAPWWSTSRTLSRGATTVWNNVVSSNKWCV